MEHQPNRRRYPRLVATKVTDAHYERLCQDAEAYGKSLCAYVRDRLTPGKPIRAQVDEQVLSELRRIGGLIKHVRAPGEIVAALDRLALRIN